MNRKIIIGVWFLIASLILPELAYGELYQYVDKEGRMHFTDRPEEVPEPYRAQLKPVQKQITIEKNKNNKIEKFFESLDQKEIKWQDFVIFDSKGNPVGMKLKKLICKSMLQSNLIVWLSVEMAMLILAIFLILTFRNLPTRKGRIISIISIILAYCILAPTILFLLLFPSAHKFLAITRVYLAEIKTNLKPDPALQNMLNNMEQKLQSYQNKIP